MTMTTKKYFCSSSVEINSSGEGNLSEAKFKTLMEIEPD